MRRAKATIPTRNTGSSSWPSSWRNWCAAHIECAHIVVCNAFMYLAALGHWLPEGIHCASCRNIGFVALPYAGSPGTGERQGRRLHWHQPRAAMERIGTHRALSTPRAMCRPVPGRPLPAAAAAKSECAAINAGSATTDHARPPQQMRKAILDCKASATQFGAVVPVFGPANVFLCTPAILLGAFAVHWPFGG